MILVFKQWKIIFKQKEMKDLTKRVEEINTAFVAFKIGRITETEKNIRIRGILRELEKETTGCEDKLNNKVNIILDNGVELYIDKNTKSKRCECGAMIYFAKTKKGKLMPVHETVNRWVSHFVNCPLDNKYRKQRNRKEAIK